MLYDPKWEKQAETEAKPFSRAHVIAWLETKDPAETYCYTDNGRCLIAQYLEYLGHKKVNVWSGGRYWIEGKSAVAPEWFWWAAVAGGSAARWTFGGALDRVRRA